MSGPEPDWPPLPAATSGEWCDTVVEPVSCSGRTLLVLPFRAPVERSRARRYEVTFGNGKPSRRLVLSLAGRAALIPPAGCSHNQPLAVRIRALPEFGGRRTSGELERKLAEYGASLDDIPAHEVNQLVLMINEARSPEIRSARITAAIASILARTGCADDC